MARQHSGELFARLITLRNQAGSTLYERLKLADQLLSDRDWVRASEGGGGDESTALDRLEAVCFGDICGALSLVEMLEVLHTVPELKVWQQNKFNLRKMHLEVKARKQAQQAAAPTSQGRAAAKSELSQARTDEASAGSQAAAPGESPAPDLAEEVRHLRQELHQRDVELRSLRKENKRLRAALRKVKEMVGKLQSV